MRYGEKNLAVVEKTTRLSSRRPPSDVKDKDMKERHIIMKTATEIDTLTSWIADVKSLLTFDRSDEDEALQGIIQAHQDLAFENHRPDVFQLELIGRWSPAYAEGYRQGRIMANKVFSALQTRRRGFPDVQKFNATEHYGSAR